MSPQITLQFLSGLVLILHPHFVIECRLSHCLSVCPSPPPFPCQSLPFSFFLFFPPHTNNNTNLQAQTQKVFSRVNTSNTCTLMTHRRFLQPSTIISGFISEITNLITWNPSGNKIWSSTRQAQGLDCYSVGCTVVWLRSSVWSAQSPWAVHGLLESLVANSGHRIRCKRACRTRIDDAVRIVHVFGNLVPSPRGCRWRTAKQPPIWIEGPLFDTTKKDIIGERGLLKTTFPVMWIVKPRVEQKKNSNQDLPMSCVEKDWSFFESFKENPRGRSQNCFYGALFWKQISKCKEFSPRKSQLYLYCGK